MLGKTGIDISKVVYGGIISMNEEQVDSDRYVSYAIDRGVNYFDVAPGYGNAQTILGKSIKSYRNDIYLACKTAEFTLEAGKLQIAESLKLLNTDYFDVFQLHALSREEDLEQVFSENGIMNYLIQAKKEGIIRNIGFSAHNEDVAIKATQMFDFDTILFPFNWATSLGKSFGDRLLAVADQKGMGKLALKTLAYRLWKNDEIKEFHKCWYKPIDRDDPLAMAAMKYTLSLGVDTIVPPGHFEYLEFVLDNIDECIKNPLNEEDMALLKDKLSGLEDNLIF
jgi:aryl-alcohol dehydrogenase-like predicted oxidoreductase